MIKFNENLRKALKKSEKEMHDLGHPFIGCEHFILGVLKFENNGKNILNSFGVTYENYKNDLIKKVGKSASTNKYIFYNSILKRIIDVSIDNMNELSSNELLIEHILISIIDSNSNIALSILKDSMIDIDSLYKELIKSITKNKELLMYTLGTCFNELAKENKLDKVIGRDKEINKIMEVLARKNKNNPLLIGEAGVGKTALVEGLATRIESGYAPEFLKNSKIISISLASIISGTKYRGEFEEKLSKIIKEAEDNKEIILFVDEIHTIMGAGGAEGAIDACNILKPALARNNIRLIGATTTQEYKKFIARDKAFDRRLQKIYVEEPSIKETTDILKKVKKDYENFHNVKIDNKMINSIVELSNKYIFDRHEPDKSLDILDEVCAKANIIKSEKINKEFHDKIVTIAREKEKAIKEENYVLASKLKAQEEVLKKSTKNNKHKNITLSMIVETIESKCNSKINENINIKNKLNKRVFGQEDAINKLNDIFGIYDDKNANKTLSILLYGSAHTGKHTCAFELAKIRNMNFVELNMEEFSTELSVNKISGSPQGYIGYNDNNTTFEEIKIKPNSLIYISNIDSAHKTVSNLIFNIIKTKKLKLSNGDVINFSNCIFVFSKDTKNNTSLGFINSSSNPFTEEINNIEYKIYFKNLDASVIKKIINTTFKKLIKNYEKDFNITNDQIEYIINNSKYEKYNAKNIESLVREIITKNKVKS